MRGNWPVIVLGLALVAPLPVVITLAVREQWVAAGFANLAWTVLVIGAALWAVTRGK